VGGARPGASPDTRGRDEQRGGRAGGAAPGRPATASKASAPQRARSDASARPSSPRSDATGRGKPGKSRGGRRK
jgi:hypothetical protein